MKLRFEDGAQPSWLVPWRPGLNQVEVAVVSADVSRVWGVGDQGRRLLAVWGLGFRFWSLGPRV